MRRIPPSRGISHRRQATRADSAREIGGIQVAKAIGLGDIMRRIDAPLSDTDERLAQGLIDEFLAIRAETRQTIQCLPQVESLKLLTAAVNYATLRLARIAA